VLLRVFSCYCWSSCVVVTLFIRCYFTRCCLACCYFTHCSSHTLFFLHMLPYALLFSDVTLLTDCSSHMQFQIPTSPSSCRSSHIDASILLILLCSYFFHQHGTSPPLFAMCKLKIKGWSSHMKGKLFFSVFHIFSFFWFLSFFSLILCCFFVNVLCF
jgi:hypothetical protein